MIVDKVTKTLPIHQGFSQLPSAVFISRKCASPLALPGAKGAPRSVDGSLLDQGGEADQAR